MCIYLCVYVDGVYTYVYMSSVSISSDIEFYIEQYIEFVYMCVYIDGVYTARSREDETGNARRNANRNPRWSSQVSFQMARLKRDMNVDHRNARRNANRNPRWSTFISLFERAI